MKLLFIGFLSLLVLPDASLYHDFGTDGLKGLTSEQQEKLSKGEIVFASSDSGESTLIEAVIIFNVTPETSWKLISKTEDQSLYLNESKEIEVISKTPEKAVEVHTAGVMFMKFVYGVMEYYHPHAMWLRWELDANYPENDLRELSGYWQLYSYGNGQTLARYGNKASAKNVPRFIEDMFKKGGVRKGLASVKKYVDSGGMHRK